MVNPQLLQRRIKSKAPDIGNTFAVANPKQTSTTMEYCYQVLSMSMQQ
jgi:hypothetical protein